MGRHILVAAALALILAPAATAAKDRSWAQEEIELVTSRGLLGGNAATFRPDDPLSQGDLADLAAGLTGREAPMLADPSTPATIAQLDAQLVRALGLADTARLFTAGVRAAGLTPPGRFGTEVVARLLGLRKNHDAENDGREILPDAPATRAEAAYSAAKILRFSGWEVEHVRGLGLAFSLPALAGLEQQVLQAAVQFIGYPYIWGGTSERPQELFGRRVNGGFDCSGFVWRIFKLQQYPGAEALADVIKGRTTYKMSAEVAKKQRIALAAVQPGDLLFFGPAGKRSKPSQITHMGVYLGGGWFIQASEQGVALSPITGWYEPRFAWARRPLAELPTA